MAGTKGNGTMAISNSVLNNLSNSFDILENFSENL